MLLCYGLAATAVIVATATAVVSGISAATTATAEQDEDKDYNPRTVITTKITHYRKPPFLFSSHTMQTKGVVLLKNLDFLFTRCYNTLAIGSSMKLGLRGNPF